MSFPLRTFSVLLLLSAAACSAAGQMSAAAKLPVRRVVLYKNGVGYFEHTGKVQGNQELTIDFTSAQLNDALKSLTLIDEGEGRITGVRYNSAKPLDQQLRTLHVSLGRDVTYASLLSSLRGSRVEVRDKGVATIGRVLAVEERNVNLPQDDGKKPPIQQDWLSMVTDAGDVKSFVVGPALTVKPLEGEMRDDLNRYLQMLASARAEDLRRMTVATQGQGEREIFVSYISEVPVWKTSYRILLSPDASKAALLQGWAIVDNTVGEDWNNIELSLVSGAPQSFVQNLSQPYYVRRPEVPLPTSAMLTPQTHEETVAVTSAAPVASSNDGVPSGAIGGVIGGIVGSSGGPQKAKQFDRLEQFSQLQSVGSGGGVGIGAGTIGKLSDGTFITNSGTNLYDAVTESLSRLDSASGNELGGLFEYKIKERVTIAKNQSALVPIINSHIDAEHVTLWNQNEAAPLRAIWLTNTSGETLDGGSFSIMDGNAFAGEGIFEAIHPKEKRLLSYAVDDAVRIVREGKRERKPLRHLRIAKGAMIETTEERESTTYTIRNADGRERNVILEHPKQENWKLVSEAQPEETTATLKVEMVHPLVTRVLLANFNDEDLALLIQHTGGNSELTPQLRKLIDQRAVVSALEGQLSIMHAKTNDIQQDQQRLRENMKALKGSAEERALLQRYTGELNTQEDELASFKKQITDVEAKRDQARQTLADMIASTSFDGDL